MLQQTTVATVGPYFQRFVERWPTVTALAGAEDADVMAAWAGLGYYARARNLLACARAVRDRHAGRFPDTEATLKSLPGIGDYTAAAVAAIAFDRPAAVLDSNVERVMARLRGVDTPLPAAKPELRDHLSRIAPDRRPGDFAQAMMDLGAMVCTPRRPKCLMCPLAEDCRARAEDRAETLPAKAPKTPRPTRTGMAFVLTDRDGAVLLRRRPARGLLGGMMEVPTTDWTVGMIPTLAAARSAAPARTTWRQLPGEVRHTFTHFHLELAVAVGRVDLRPRIDRGEWVPVDALGEAGLPTVMRKVVRHAFRHAG